MSTHQRAERVGQEIQAAVAELLARGRLKDPRIGFITITGVKVSADLRNARIFWSMIGTDEAKDETQKGLDAARGFVRRQIAEQVKLRHSPEIIFSFDDSIGEGDKIERLLREVKAKEGW